MTYADAKLDAQYTDEWLMVHDKPIELGNYKTYSENPIVFTAYRDVLEPIGGEAAFRILRAHVNDDGTIAQTPWDRRLASHDNITAFKYLAHKYGFHYSIPTKQLLTKYVHPRDLIFLTGQFNPFLVLTAIPNKKITPWYGARVVIEHTRTKTNVNDNGKGYVQEYWSKLGEPDVLIERNEMELDGTLLNVLRFSTVNMPVTSFMAHHILKRSMGNDYLYKSFYHYFHQDLNHPVVRRSKLALDFNYRSL